MKRLGIFVFYDKDGIADEYVFYLINSIKDVVDELIIVINGTIADDALDRMKSISHRIFIRNNIGFDGGAYKDVFTEYLSPSELLSYDEIVMMNDTFFGPFFCWNEVFSQMDRIACDFWGLTRNGNGGKTTEHIQAYFIVMRHSIFSSIFFMKFWERLCYPINYKEAVQNFEKGFSVFFKKRGFNFTSYADVQGFDFLIAWSPSLLLKANLDFPIWKVRGFEDILEIDSKSKLLETIEKNTKYDISLIKGCRRKHYYAYFDKLLDFCSSHSCIYIYGYGKYGKAVGYYLSKNDIHFTSYLVTSIKEKNIDIKQEPVQQFSSIRFSDKSGIIIAMNKKNTDEILQTVQNKVSARNVISFYDGYWSD